MNYKHLLIIVVALVSATLVSSCPRVRQNATLCHCNGHSINCQAATSSSNCQNDSSNGLVTCIDCQNGTSGEQCQLCKSGHFRPSTEDLRSICKSML